MPSQRSSADSPSRLLAVGKTRGGRRCDLTSTEGSARPTAAAFREPERCQRGNREPWAVGHRRNADKASGRIGGTQPCRLEYGDGCELSPGGVGGKVKADVVEANSVPSFIKEWNFVTFAAHCTDFHRQNQEFLPKPSGL